MIATTVVRLAPACHVIDAFGGPGSLAGLLGVHRSTVARWEMPIEHSSGTGGAIPQKRFEKIIELAKAQGLEWITRAALVAANEEVVAPLRSMSVHPLKLARVG